MIPIHAVIIPMLMILRRLGLVNTRLGIILAYTVAELSFSIFILVAFMKTIPREIEEAAQIDGSSRLRTFFQIILPISKPGLATIGTFAFINSWNDLLLALVITSGPKLSTLNLACFNLRGLYVQHYGLITAGLMIMMIPVIVIYIFFQEQLVKGITAQSDFLTGLETEKDQYQKIVKQLKSNKVLKAALEDPEAKAALLSTLRGLISELTEKK